MAPRSIKIRHDEETRAKIRTSQLINRLENHAFGDVELTPTQVRSIEILLRKSLSDLSTVAIGQSEEHGPVAVNVFTGIPPKVDDSD